MAMAHGLGRAFDSDSTAPQKQLPCVPSCLPLIFFVVQSRGGCREFTRSPRKRIRKGTSATLPAGVAFARARPTLLREPRSCWPKPGRSMDANPKRASTSDIGRSSTMGGSSAASARAFARFARGNGACASCAARVRTRGMELTGYGRSTGFSSIRSRRSRSTIFSLALRCSRSGRRLNLACSFCQNRVIWKTVKWRPKRARAPETIARAPSGWAAPASLTL